MIVLLPLPVVSYPITISFTQLATDAFVLCPINIDCTEFTFAAALASLSPALPHKATFSYQVVLFLSDKYHTAIFVYPVELFFRDSLHIATL